VWKNGENFFHCVEKKADFFHSVENRDFETPTALRRG